MISMMFGSVIFNVTLEKCGYVTGGFRGGGRDVRPPPKKPKKPKINTKINGEERKQRERREVQSLRLKLS